MTRKLETLILVAMGLTVLGAVGASSSPAAEFHCSVEPCRYTVGPDGAVGGKTAHHIILIKRGGESTFLTCNTISAESTTKTKTSNELTISNVKYEGCVGSEILMNGCDYLIEANGSFNIVCPAGNEIELKVPATGCVVKIGPQLLMGAAFHNIGNEATKTTEMTVSLAINGIAGSVNNKCPIKEGAFAEGEYTTGNMLFTGATDPGNVMANAWWV